MIDRWHRCMYEEIQHQIDRNRQRTTALATAAVANAGMIALMLGLVCGTWILAFVVLTAFAIWVIATYHIFQTSVLSTLEGRSLTIRERHRILPLLDRVAQRLGIAPPHLLVASDPSANALAIGAGAQSVVVCTSGLLELLEDDELEGVLAHECSHIANHDTEIAALSAALLGWTVVATTFATLFIVTILAWGTGMLMPQRDGRRDRDSSEMVASIIVGLILVTLAITLWMAVRCWLLVSELTYLAISREREWLADATAAYATRNPLALARALEKIAMLEMPFARGKVWTKTLVILGQRCPRRWWGQILDTHPDTHSRIERLRSFAALRSDSDFALAITGTRTAV